MTAANHPARFESPSGLRVEMNANGSIRRIDHGEILLNLFLGSEIEGGPTNIYLRRGGGTIESTPLLGPSSPGCVDLDERGLTIHGEWKDLRFVASLVLAQSAAAWLWRVEIENTGNQNVTVDLIYAQDLALAQYGAVRMNEYYVSQYIDYTPLEHPRCGTVLAVRQNLLMSGNNPWVVVGALDRAVSFATDALQLHGLATRAGEVPEALRASMLPGRRLQHEHSMSVLQAAPIQLASGSSLCRGFFAWFEANHPAASSAADLHFVDRALALPEAIGFVRTPTEIREGSADTLFSTCPTLASLELTDSEADEIFGKQRRNVEREDGRLFSFFTGVNRHVVFKAKELQALRPHGHLLRSGDHLVPDERSLTSTTWMAGVFNSLVTQGHVGINRFLSTTRSYLGLLRSGGQRIFVERPDGYVLLGMPSAYEMSPNACRWIYKHDDGLIQIRSWAPMDRHELNLSIDVVDGAPCRFLISHHVAINGDDGADAVPVDCSQDRLGVVVRAIADSDVGCRFPQGFFRIDATGGTTLESVGGDELLFADGCSRRQPFLALVTVKTTSAQFRITGHLIPTADEPTATGTYAADEIKADRFWSAIVPAQLQPAGSATTDDVARLQEIIPWLAHNALVHYLAPRGLEQYSGGGWGTRDVSQGPVEMLLSLAAWAPFRDLLVRLFRAQNADGDWPQWFMFFERERDLRPSDSHGDIIFWPLLALSQYILAADDASILDELAPFYHSAGEPGAETATVWGHVERALQTITERKIPGTHLVAYGHGDWNDSLQPVDPAMAARLCSAWTVTLHYQTLTALAQALRRTRYVERAEPLEAEARMVHDDFQRRLIADGTLAGYGYFTADGDVELLIHPSDHGSGIHYSLLPMIHAIINDMFSATQAQAHVEQIKAHLLGVDGARLFDRPFNYQGGPQRTFQRAESSTFFGREIGLMYTHAHLRYAEAMAHYGDVDAFFLALQQANPVGVKALVAAARPRQANCYYSSSDAVFADRYEALAQYDKVKTGAVPLEGGWRVYSIGAGVALRLIHECLLGIRRTKSVLVIDPAMPKSLDGLRATFQLAGKSVRIEYRIAARGYGPTVLTLNGEPLAFVRRNNPYRSGGVEVTMSELAARLVDGLNELHLQLA